MGTERWHAEIYYRDGRKSDVAYTDSKTSTQWQAQQIFDQHMKFYTNPHFQPTMIVLVRDK